MSWKPRGNNLVLVGYPSRLFVIVGRTNNLNGHGSKNNGYEKAKKVR